MFLCKYMFGNVYVGMYVDVIMVLIKLFCVLYLVRIMLCGSGNNDVIEMKYFFVYRSCAFVGKMLLSKNWYLFFIVVKFFIYEFWCSVVIFGMCVYIMLGSISYVAIVVMIDFTFDFDYCVFFSVFVLNFLYNLWYIFK